MEPLLIYDGDCAFCSSSVRFIERRVKRHPRLEPWQRLDLDALGLTVEQCQAAVQWVGADGLTASGHEAVGRLLVHAGGAWGLVGRTILAPGVRSVAKVTYSWVARNRHRLPGGTPECSLPSADRQN
ncbi:MAG: DUF393 domain-containing protein [Actinobacteria bacterium]|nr:DUF393 domain-containing protein [Actinomycetota bacterium]